MLREGAKLGLDALSVMDGGSVLSAVDGCVQWRRGPDSTTNKTTSVRSPSPPFPKMPMPDPSHISTLVQIWDLLPPPLEPLKVGPKGRAGEGVHYRFVVRVLEGDVVSELVSFFRARDEIWVYAAKHNKTALIVNVKLS